MLTLITALSLVTPALANPPSIVRISSDAPFAGFQLDGAFLEYGENGQIVVEVTQGRHEIVVFKGFGKELFRGMFDVPVASEVRCRFLKATSVFECYDAAPLAVAPAPVVAPLVVAPAASATTTITTTTTDTVTAGVSVGGVGIGVGIAVDDATGSASVQVGGGLLGMPVGTSTTTTTVQTTTVGDPGFAAPAPAAAPTSVRLVLRSLDGEWADVLVNGKVVAEFRNEDEKVVTIPAGLHTIEIREFMEEVPYAKGRLETGYATTITFGLREGAPVEVYDHDGWFPR